MKPFVSFESNRQKRADSLFKFLLGGLITFILFGIIGKYVLKKIGISI